MFKSIVCLVMASVMCLNAVTVQNNTPYPLKLKNFSFINGKEIGLLPVTVKPGAIFSQHDIARFEMCANGKSRVFEDLKDSDNIIVTWSNDDLVIESHQAHEDHEFLHYDKGRDLYYLITNR